MSSLADPVSFDLRDGEEVVIEVHDPNPLLFVYKLDGVTTKDTLNKQTIDQLAAHLGSLMSGLQAGTAAAPSPRDR